MGAFQTRTLHDRTEEFARIVRKLERRLKALLARRLIGCGGASNSRIGAKQLLTTLSNKVAPLMHRRRSAGAEEEQDQGFSGGLWQKEILMGEKCQPLNFSGVIYYDKHGNPSDAMPARSPRGSPFLQTVSFPSPPPQKTGH